MRDDAGLVEALRSAGQSAAAERLRALSGAAAGRLAEQLRRFDMDLVARLAGLVRSRAGSASVGEFEPAPVTRADRPAEQVAAARRAGREEIARGRVAAFVVAGGQGTRLRFDGPKGCYPVGPASGKTLFRIHAEKVLAAGRRAGVSIPLYVMTSETNDAAVREFFAENARFGLPPDDVFFCVQRMLPAFDARGEMIFDRPDHVFVSPDGHGGSYFALESSGALDDMERRGIRRVSYFQVDNPLVSAVDPEFIGEHVRSGSEMSSKVLRKREPLEKLGVFGFVDGELRVVEYSEMSTELQRQTLPDGSLKYAFGSIAVHVIDAGLARRMAGADLPFHVARKAVPTLDDSGDPVTPAEPNGFKLERFVFDAVPRARNPLVLEVEREEEFAPVKNFEGDDSPETARAAMLAKHRRLLEAAGLAPPPGVGVEISPLFAGSADELKERAAEVEARLQGAAPGDKIYLE
jgi:UDP-N-acetylglucosamine/UDP-N-acetylgalactosamine diphosphorylase